MNRSHFHPDYHVKALALASRGMRNQSQGVKFLESGDAAWLRESAVNISWALADAADSAHAEGFARGRLAGYREGMLAAATSVGNTASTVAGHGDISDNIADYLARVAVRLRDMAVSK